MSGTLHGMSLILLTFSSSVTRSLGINLCDIVLNLESDTPQTVMCLFDQVIGYIRHALVEHLLTILVHKLYCTVCCMCRAISNVTNVCCSVK